MNEEKSKSLKSETCPNCGYCQSCGRSNQLYPYPWYPYINPYPGIYTAADGILRLPTVFTVNSDGMND